MTLLYTPESRAERLIAGGRVVLAASSLFAVWLDPTEPAKYEHVAYALLVAYVAYAAAIAVLVARATAPSNRQRIVTHVFDLAFFSLFTYFTSGPAESPFIAYFVFSLVSATLRWRWRGTLWTALVALATFLSLGFYFAEVLDDTSFEVTPFIIRAVYLSVFAVLLGYLGAHEERTRREMAMLAAWPNPVGRGPAGVTRELLATASLVLRAPLAVAIWSESEEPGMYVASWRDGSYAESREPPAALDPPVAPKLSDCCFLCLDPAQEQPLVLLSENGLLSTWRGAPLHPDLPRRFGRGSVLALPLRGETIQGRLLFLGRPDLTSDDLVLGEIVAGIVTARLDQASMIEQLRATAAADERIRLARDLHDGALQSFTGIGLQIAAARRLADEQPQDLATHLGGLQRLLAEEQRDLRFLIHELQASPLGDGASWPLGARLGELARRIEQAWGVQVRLRADGLCGEPAGNLAREVYSMVREAVINAARHGAARRVDIAIASDDAGRVTVTIADDGHGFSFSGRLDEVELRRRDLGPRSLRERVTALGGHLVVDSRPTGATVELRMPGEGAVA